jgi:protein ImuB
MVKRFVSVWFPHLLADWQMLRRPELQGMPYVFVVPAHGQFIITAASVSARAQGIEPGMRSADAKAIVPAVEVIDDKPDRSAKLLKGIGEWCIRYSPIVALDLPEGLILDSSGCAHLWGGEDQYLKEIVSRLKSKGYHVQAAMADTIGTAWAISRFSQMSNIIESGKQLNALLPLTPAALRLDESILQRLQKLGFYQIKSFITMPRSILRRRFGETLLLRLAHALGKEDEVIQPIQPPVLYQERLPCLEPIRTATGIEIAMQRMLENLCPRLQSEGKGIRTAIVTCYRIDGKVEKVEIGTNRPSHSVSHLFKLLALKIASITPDLGIELFVLDAPKVEDVSPMQEALWAKKPGLDDQSVAELLDRLSGKVGITRIHRYLPEQRYWPENSLQKTPSLEEKPLITWGTDRPRPTQLLPKPELIEVTAPIPDYPPMLFRYKGKVHPIRKADGPERIEREWWLDEGEYRDYYHVEDEDGQRYWLFRSGPWDNKPYQWFIHGFFA